MMKIGLAVVELHQLTPVWTRFGAELTAQTRTGGNMPDTRRLQPDS